MMSVLKWFLILLAFLVLLFLFIPSPIDAVSWTPEEIPALVGDYEQNNDLDRMEKIYVGQCHACEDVAFDTDDAIYTGAENGDIVVFRDNDRSIFTNTGGRPLGLDFDDEGNLIVADARKGLLSIDPRGNINLLVSGYGGIPFLLTDDVDVGPDGIYYFTDASSKHPLERNVRDLVEHGGHGRFLSYDPKTQQTKLLIDGLQFANGVAASADTSFVLVNETGLYCVRKYWLKGPKAGTHEIIRGNLPGFPDNISTGEDGIFWLTLVAPRKADLEKLMPKAWLRNQLAKLPPSISEPKPNYYGFIMGIDAEGRIEYNFQDSDPNLLMITSVEQNGDRLVMGSLVDDGLGVMKLR